MTNTDKMKLGFIDLLDDREHLYQSVDVMDWDAQVEAIRTPSDNTAAQRRPSAPRSMRWPEARAPRAGQIKIASSTNT